MTLYTSFSAHKEAETFFDAVHGRFEDACEKTAEGLIEQYFTIGGYTLCLKYCGSALIDHVSPPLEHGRRSVCDNPDLTICLWDSASSNTEMVAPPWATKEFEHQGEIKEFNNDRIATLFQPGEDTLNLLDFSRNLGVFWRRDAINVPYYLTGAPLRSILHWWMSNNGRQFIHGAAVGKDSGGVLLIGKGGSGKSTAAISCLNSDLSYVGDDYCLMSLDPDPHAYCLYNSAKLNFDHFRRFPHLTPYLHNKHPSEEDKGLVVLQRHMPEKLISGFKIKAVLLPQVLGNTQSRIYKTSAASALAALAPSTMFQLTRNRELSFRRITQLVKSVPAFVLESGTDIESIPREIESLLESDLLDS